MLRIPVINWGVVTADLIRLWGGGKIHFMQHWMAGHTIKPLASHTKPIWSHPFRELSVFVSLSLLQIFIPLPLYRSLAPRQSQTAHSQRAFDNLRCCDIHYTTVRIQRKNPDGYSTTEKIKLTYYKKTSHSMIRLCGLFQNISDLCHCCYYWQLIEQNLEETHDRVFDNTIQWQ